MATTEINSIWKLHNDSFVFTTFTSMILFPTRYICTTESESFASLPCFQTNKNASYRNCRFDHDLVLHFDTKLYITVSNGSFVTDRKRNTVSILSVRHFSPFAPLAQKTYKATYFSKTNSIYDTIMLLSYPNMFKWVYRSQLSSLYRRTAGITATIQITMVTSSSMKKSVRKLLCEAQRTTIQVFWYAALCRPVKQLPTFQAIVVLLSSL